MRTKYNEVIIGKCYYCGGEVQRIHEFRKYIHPRCTQLQSNERRRK